MKCPTLYLLRIRVSLFTYFAKSGHEIFTFTKDAQFEKDALMKTEQKKDFNSRVVFSKSYNNSSSTSRSTFVPPPRFLANEKKNNYERYPTEKKNNFSEKFPSEKFSTEKKNYSEKFPAEKGNL